MNDDKLSGLLPGHGAGQNLSEEDLAMFAKPLNEGFLKNLNIPEGGYKRDDFIVQTANPHPTSYLADLDIVNMYNHPVVDLDKLLEVKPYDLWLKKYDSSGTVSTIQMAEILTHWEHNGKARIEFAHHVKDLKLSKKLTTNYRLLNYLRKTEGKYTHGYWLYFNIDFHHDVLVMATGENEFSYFLG